MSDARYQTYSYKLANGGLSARYTYDRLPPGRYLNLDNLESREEGTLSSRYGLAAISTNGSNTNYPLGAAVTSLGRMQGLASTYNYAQAAAGLFRKAGDNVGQYTQISSALSGNRMSMYPYRPNNNSNPYMFFADDDILLKDPGLLSESTSVTSINYAGGFAPTATVTVGSTTGMISGVTVVTISGNSNALFNQSWVATVTSLTTFTISFALSSSQSGTLGTASFFISQQAQNWGIAPPLQPALIAPAAPSLLDIELFDEANDSSFTLSGVTSASMTGRVSASMLSAVSAAGVAAVVFNTPNVTLSRTTGVTTATTGSAHNYVTGMRVAVTAGAGSTFTVTSAVITVTGADTFTYVQTGLANGTDSGQVSPLPSFMAGMSITTTDVNAETVYITEIVEGYIVANFTQTHASGTVVTSNYLTGSVAANTTGTITKIGAFNISFTNSQIDPTDNLIQLYVLASNPLAVAQISIQFDVGDGTFTQDFYSAAIGQSPAQAPASGTQLYGYAQVQAVAQRAAGGVNVSTLGGNDPSLLPEDYPLLQQMQPSVLNPAGANPWSFIQIPLANFVANGAAGGPSNNWSNVVAWRIQIQTYPTLSTMVGFDDLVFVGGSDLNSFAGQAYDYRYTYLNINTGCESGPSQIMVGVMSAVLRAAFAPIPLSVQQTGIIVQPLQPTDPQVTHINIYRRGGSLTQAWYFTTQIAVGTTTFTDTIADSIIEDNNVLTVDADAPVTSLLPQPLNTTITKTGIGIQNMGPGLVTVTVPSGTTVYPGQLVTVGASSLQEQVYVESVSGTTLTMYLQLNHGSGASTVSTPMTASTRPQLPMNLMAIAFDKAWLAGDPNNPHFLYYSTTYQPETFPVENYLEIGTPDAPIMALIELSGLLFVFTTKRVYEILGAGSAVPTAIPTGVKHGMAAQFAWCVAEGVIYYLSYDGIYAFQGGQSTYMTEPVEWIWTGKNFGPVQAINLTQKSQVVMAYWNHEIFCRYVDQNGNSHRLISQEVYGYRWRNDDQAVGNITAMYFAEDTGELFVGKDDGMVYQDRVNDFDSGGWNSQGQIKNPINYTLQSAQMDLSDKDPLNAKRNKIFNEFTLDFDSAGQNVSVSLLFNGGAGVPNGTTLALGTYSQTGRGQIQIPINAGQGQEGLNVGVLLTGAATTAVTFYEVQFRAAPQAEYRQSWDTWWLGQGSSDWKLTKQVFAEYKSQNSSITVNAFTDGNMTTPAFTFVLPQTPGAHRASKKVRLPATKYRIIRYIGTPTAGIDPNQTNNFELYDDTEFDTKSLTTGNSYQRSKISP